jgi:hypothetical protein
MSRAWAALWSGSDHRNAAVWAEAQEREQNLCVDEG